MPGPSMTCPVYVCGVYAALQGETSSPETEIRRGTDVGAQAEQKDAAMGVQHPFGVLDAYGSDGGW